LIFYFQKETIIILKTLILSLIPIKGINNLKLTMANLIDLLQGQLSEGLVEQFANQLGGADKKQTADATSSIISMITSALAKNAATPEGAKALASALDRDHDGSILDDLMGYAAGNLQEKPKVNTSAMDGAGILKHILGGKQSNAIDVISKMSGLQSDKTGNLMSMLAPIVLGMLGKQKRESNLDNSGLSDILSRTIQTESSKRKELGMIGKFLDQDGDGNIVDDLANIGMKMFGNFFKK
jgi:hypothetical protein